MNELVEEIIMKNNPNYLNSDLLIYNEIFRIFETEIKG